MRLHIGIGVRSELLHPSRSRHRLPPALPAGMMENPLFPPFLGTYFISQDSKPLELSFTERDEQSLLYESLEEERRVEDGREDDRAGGLDVRDLGRCRHKRRGEREQLDGELQAGGLGTARGDRVRPLPGGAALDEAGGGEGESGDETTEAEAGA